MSWIFGDICHLDIQILNWEHTQTILSIVSFNAMLSPFADFAVKTLNEVCSGHCEAFLVDHAAALRTPI